MLPVIVLVTVRGCACDTCEMQTVLSGCIGTDATDASASCWTFVAKNRLLAQHSIQTLIGRSNFCQNATVTKCALTEIGYL